MNLSVIIPALNEAAHIERSIRSAWKCGANQVVVVDGGSDDATCEVAHNNQALVVETEPGRGHQLKVGAETASGDVMLFLHADNRLDEGCGQQLSQSCLSYPDQIYCFRQKIDSKSWTLRAVEYGNYLRARYQKLPYGDQAITVSRRVYEETGGFRPIALMEDVDFIRRATRRFKVQVLPGPLVVSSRRWNQNGAIRQTLNNWWTMLRYRLGANPEVLAQNYQPNSDSRPEQ